MDGSVTESSFSIKLNDIHENSGIRAKIQVLLQGPEYELEKDYI